MTKKETRFTNLLRSRGIAFILSVVSAWMVWRCLPSMTYHAWQPGMFPELACVLNFGLILLTAACMIVVNRSYTLLRTVSIFFSAYFLFTTAATPAIAAYSHTSALLALTVIFCMWILFSLYNRRKSDRRVFLIFCLLSAGTLLDWKFLFYIPVFFVGLVQMRILRFKKIVAAIIGILTPPWIVFGLGLMPLPTIPKIYFTPPTLLLEGEVPWPFYATVALTLVIGFLFGLTTILRMIGFNARSRAYNGFLTIVSIFTGVLAIVNFTALQDYVILLNACVAFQVGHFFRATATRRGYIWVLILLLSYAALYVWTITTL